MTVVDVIPRRQWAPDGRDPAWKSDGTTPRPEIHPPFGVLMVHYAGAAESTAPGNQFLSGEPLTYMVNMWRWAFGVGEKGDEYNYVIAGREGIVYEWAGARRQAAHCSNWNTKSIGVQLGLDVDDAPTDAMILAFRKLRYQLEVDGILTKNHTVGPHSDYFATGCPGTKVKPDAWAALTEPWTPAPQPLTEGDDMEPLYVMGDANPEVYAFNRSTGRKRWVPPAESSVLLAGNPKWWSTILTVRQSDLDAIPTV